jgi:hypothetical protein
MRAINGAWSHNRQASDFAGRGRSPSMVKAIFQMEPASATRQELRPPRKLYRRRPSRSRESRVRPSQVMSPGPSNPRSAATEYLQLSPIGAWICGRANASPRQTGRKPNITNLRKALDRDAEEGGRLIFLAVRASSRLRNSAQRGRRGIRRPPKTDYHRTGWIASKHCGVQMFQADVYS